jgi:hypothetical protein
VRAYERGESLVEAVVVAALASIACASVLTGVIAAAHRFGPDPIEETLRGIAQRELRVAVDVLKYQGGSIVPATIATTAPLPGGSPLPIHLSITTSAMSSGGTSITIDTSADAGNERVTMTTSVARPVPLPSSQIAAPSNGQAPI